MKFKYLLFILISLCWKPQTISAAIQSTRLRHIQDTSVTDGCVRIQVKNYKRVHAKINYHNKSKLTFTPCFPAGLPPQTVDWDDILSITDETGKVLFDVAVEGNAYSSKVAKTGTWVSLLGGITATVGIQLFLIPTFPVSALLLALMVGIPLVSLVGGANALVRYYRGRDFNKWYHRIAWIGTLFSLLMGLISIWFLESFH
jgi:hypothetical protein